MVRLHVVLVDTSVRPDAPWIVPETTWDGEFVDDLLKGNSTGSDLVALIGDGRLGTGDVAILVERDRFQQKTANASVEVWTLDDELAAHSKRRPSQQRGRQAMHSPGQPL